MILYIAEKPSLGRAIAAAIPGRHQNQDGCIHLANGDIVSWCIGHLLEQADPEVYASRFKQWRQEDLPIVPEKWQLKAKSQTRKQLGIVKKLIKSAEQIVHAGDPDREGQLLVDEVINYSGLAAAKKQKVLRCLISDLNTSAVKRSLNNLKSNREFIPLATSALARTRADWLYGINMTRLCTLQGQQSGYSGVLSVGRVQTPLLGLVVQRDWDIEAFNSKPFYQLLVTLTTEANESFQAKWRPSEACADYQDDEGRVLSKALIENVIARIQGKSGTIDRVLKQDKSQAAPLPYSLSSLQIDAAKIYGLSAKVVLDTAQQLYEKHKLITYPRSDCRYLPLDHFNQATELGRAIENNCSALKSAAQQADFKIKSKAWNDKKISAHHAIIPTAKRSGTINATEAKVYQLIARQYLMQFYPALETCVTTIDAIIGGGIFIAKLKETKQQGWKNLVPASKNKPDNSNETGAYNAQLPTLSQGQSVICEQAQAIEKITSPAKHYTDATLLAAMTGIARHVNNPDIKKILRDTDGLGTEATRAGIIELLFKRDYLCRKGKQIHATDIGRQLIKALPDSMGQADMTAHWESQLESISQAQSSYGEFMQAMQDSLFALVDEVGRLRFTGLPRVSSKATKKKRKYRKKPRS